ncbi:MAG: hypothetical protein C5B52_08765 [Bacteroidetes bacterium]|nr:MAG: hypothetical protein C5B52_08765 [Bacteroidota bacterium]
MAREFVLCDGFNLFHRSIHMTNPSAGLDSMIGLSFHLILYSLKKEWTQFNATHAVFFIEGRSWRRNVYPEYKANRRIVYAQMTQKEQEDQEILTEAFEDLVTLLNEKTNVTVLQNPEAEADDMIACWIRMHPDDNHTLVSSDSDFYQLLAPNVKIYDPIKNILITHERVTNDNGKNMRFTLKDGKLTDLKPDPDFVPDPEWYKYALFLKIIRGDATDNIFSAYPKVREKGTKNSVGIREAYEDRNGKGYSWNNFMLQKWVDHNKQEQRVKDAYERNRILIDLNAQPDNIREGCERIVKEQIAREAIPAPEIGLNFMKFCGRWGLKRIQDNAQQFVPFLKAKYNAEEVTV